MRRSRRFSTVVFAAMGGEFKAAVSNGAAAVPSGIAQAAASPQLVVELKPAKRVVDLRSDTVTKPTAQMLVAMANAEVDDDVLGVDPTVQKLQQQMAKVCGKEAGLFVPSGTMGNLISVLVHCEVSRHRMSSSVFFSLLLLYVAELL